MSRRGLGGLAAALAGAAVAAPLLGGLSTAAAARASAGAPTEPWDRRNRSARTLRDGNPRAAGLDGETLDRIPGLLRDGIAHDPQRFSSAIALVAGQGVVAHRSAEGHARKWASPEETLPEDQWLAAETDTIYDLASISKLFTATAVLQLVEQGVLDLDGAITDWIPEFGTNGKDGIVLRQLLTHTSGLQPFLLLYQLPTLAERYAAIWESELAAPIGSDYIYSDLGLITLGVILERASGTTLDAYVAEHITEPLGMGDTMYTPPAELRPRIAATEHQPWTDRDSQPIWGEVHDENAWSFGGVAGHAGIFSTLDDMAVFAQMFLNGGAYGGARILETATVHDMFTDQIGDLGGAHRGLGPELEAFYYHSGLTSPSSAGHTGYTGTSLVIDPLSDSFVILLANSVHPTRDWSATSFTRRQVAHCVLEDTVFEP